MSVKPRVRVLYDWEIEEFRPVFGDTLRYPSVRVHEGVGWPDAADRVGRFLKRLPPPGRRDHNAVTLGNHCYFPVLLPEALPPSGAGDEFMLDWLVHELTHAWQYQHIGLRYLTRALSAQFKYKELAYDYGGAEGLTQRRQEGWTFHNYNPEQQGNITQAFYYRKRKGWDLTAWEPYIADVHSTPAPGSAR